MKMSKNILEWFNYQQKKLSIEVIEIPMSECVDWKILKKDGVDHGIYHNSGKYHRGVFLKSFDSARGEFVERFLIAPVPDEKNTGLYGVVLIAKYKDKYLVQAKSEPGNPTKGHVQVTSTIHSSYKNMEEELSGHVHFQWMYKDPNCFSFVISQDGAQLYKKNNKVCFLELKEGIEDIPENFYWATKDEIELLSQNEGLVSEHVMQCLGVEILSRKS